MSDVKDEELGVFYGDINITKNIYQMYEYDMLDRKVKWNYKIKKNIILDDVKSFLTQDALDNLAVPLGSYIANLIEYKDTHDGNNYKTVYSSFMTQKACRFLNSLKKSLGSCSIISQIQKALFSEMFWFSADEALYCMARSKKDGSGNLVNLAKRKDCLSLIFNYIIFEKSSIEKNEANFNAAQNLVKVISKSLKESEPNTDKIGLIKILLEYFFSTVSASAEEKGQILQNLENFRSCIIMHLALAELLHDGWDLHKNRTIKIEKIYDMFIKALSSKKDEDKRESADCLLLYFPLEMVMFLIAMSFNFKNADSVNNEEENNFPCIESNGYKFGVTQVQALLNMHCANPDSYKKWLLFICRVVICDLTMFNNLYSIKQQKYANNFSEKLIIKYQKQKKLKQRIQLV